MVTADRAVIAKAENVLHRLIVERDRLRNAKNLMPNDDERLCSLNTDLPFLKEQIRIAKLML